jgi:putative cardiolipin synthase
LIDDPAFAEEVRAHYAAAIARERSWEVRLVEGRLRWVEEADGREVLREQDPEAGVGRRLTAFLFRLLPLDRQL